MKCRNCEKAKQLKEIKKESKKVIRLSRKLIAEIQGTKTGTNRVIN